MTIIDGITICPYDEFKNMRMISTSYGIEWDGKLLDKLIVVKVDLNKFYEIVYTTEDFESRALAIFTSCDLWRDGHLIKTWKLENEYIDRYKNVIKKYIKPYELKRKLKQL